MWAKRWHDLVFVLKRTDIYTSRHIPSEAHTEPAVLHPWRVLRIAAAATSIVLHSVRLLCLEPQMVWGDTAACPAHEKFIVLAIRSKIYQKLERRILQDSTSRTVAHTRLRQFRRVRDEHFLCRFYHFLIFWTEGHQSIPYRSANSVNPLKNEVSIIKFGSSCIRRINISRCQSPLATTGLLLFRKLANCRWRILSHLPFFHPIVLVRLTVGLLATPFPMHPQVFNGFRRRVGHVHRDVTIDAKPIAFSLPHLPRNAWSTNLMRKTFDN